MHCAESDIMYLETGLGQVFKPRPKYRAPQLINVSPHWGVEVPFRKKFTDFRRELSKVIGQLVMDKNDKTEIDRLLLKDKSMEVKLKDMHDRLLKRKSPALKESDAVPISATIYFKKLDYTNVDSISVY